MAKIAAPDAARGRTTLLRRALKQDFYPLVERAGFAVDQRYQPQSTVFRRARGPVVHLFELQWEKYGRPRFAIRFGTCSAAGLQVNSELFAPDQVLPTWCPDAGSLQPRRGGSTRSWFRQDRSRLRRLLWQPALRTPSEVVDELSSLFPELENYWSTGEVGEHMRIWNDVPGPGR